MSSIKEYLFYILDFLSHIEDIICIKMMEHILFIIIEKIKGSPVKPETEAKFHAVGLFLLMLLMIYVTFNDILILF